jgi:hypothetical protein
LCGTLVLDGSAGAFNGLINGLLDGSGRGAGEFGEFIDVIFPVRFFRCSRITASDIRLVAAAGGAGFLQRLLDRFAGFPGTLLDPANKFFLLAFGVLEIVIRELGPFLFQLALGDVPVAFDFEFSHNSF